MFPENDYSFYSTAPESALRRMRKCHNIEVESEKIQQMLKEKFHNEDDEAEENLPAEPPFTEKELAWIKQFNMRLRHLEQELYQEAEKQYKKAKKRIDNDKDWVSDSEFEMKISFYLGKDDPDFEEENDNIIITLGDNLNFPSKNHGSSSLKIDYYGINDGINHNGFRSWKQSQMYGDYHCWLLHTLYDHTHLRWSEILRIRDISVEFEMITQVACEDTKF